jgi:ABC-2 type transport system ATP-binding protein
MRGDRLMDPIIEARDLSKWFGEVVAVNNLQLTIGPGITGLLGPNGAGKTTFIKLALGLYAPSRGVIRVFGETPRNNLAILTRIGYCPEADKFYDTMTGYEFVYWMNRFWGMSPAAAHKKAEESLDRVKMSDRMDDLIAEYSRGMRQRIKIAQALAPDPEMLFLDEPMAGLDPEGREELFALIRSMGDEGLSVIFSTHILYEVERVTNQVVLLHNGCVLAQGDVRQIRDLIDEHPHAVTIACTDPHQAASHFISDSAILGVEFSDGSVTIRTRDPNAFYQRLNEYIVNEGVTVTSIRCPDDNLQSVFDYLVKK